MNFLGRIRLKRLLKIVGSNIITKKSYKAVSLLGRTGDPAAFEPLVKVLRSNFPSYSAAAVEALGNLGNPAAITHLKQSVCSIEPELRLKAAEAMKKLGEPLWQTLVNGDGDDFSRLITSNDEPVIRNIVGIAGYAQSIKGKENYIAKQLAGSNNPLVTKIVRGIVADPDYYMKYSYIYIKILGDIRDIESVPVLTGLLQNDPGNLRAGEAIMIKKAAIIALGNIGDKKNRDILKRYLADINHGVRISAANALSELGESQWKDIVTGNDSDFENLGVTKDRTFLQPLTELLRQQALPEAARALAASGFKEAIEPLRITLVNDSGKLRKAAAEALSKMGEPWWEEIIKGEVSDYTRMGESGRPEALDLLMTYINDHYQDMYSSVEDRFIAATKALEKVNKPELIDKLRALLRNPENASQARFQIVKALGNIGDPKAIDALIESLETLYYGWDITSSEGRERVSSDLEIIKALGKIGDNRATPALTDILNKEQETVNNDLSKSASKQPEGKINSTVHYRIREKEQKICAIISALGMIGGKDVIKPLSELLRFQTIPVRRQAAETLVDLAKKDFSTISQKWRDIRESLETSHKDHGDGINRNSMSDCSHTDTYTHTDTGIGLELPPELIR